MAGKVGEATARTAARQAWLLAGLGLAGGALSLVVFGWVLQSAQREREEIDRVQSQGTVLVATMQTSLARGRAELRSHLSGGEPEQGEADWLPQLGRVIRAFREEARGSQIETLLLRLEGERTGLVALREACRS